ncbi:MAG: helix-turn-helix domain-containing protein [Patescibacteria group bacterium]
MARREDKNKALVLRKKGYSYSQIKEELNISKSTLSGWLASYPLSVERIKELRDNSPRRIERYRNTMKLKREARLSSVYKKVKEDIGKLSNREIFLAGMFLYWAEGYKRAISTTALGNTDPTMLRFFIKWLKVINAPIHKITVRLHIYADMDEKKAIQFWCKELSLPEACFVKTYVKKSNLSGLTYKNGFGHGTCNILIYNQDLHEYVLSSLQYIRSELT